MWWSLLTVWPTLLDLAQQLRSTEIRSAIARLGFETVPSGIDRCSELYITRIEAHHLPGGVSSIGLQIT